MERREKHWSLEDTKGLSLRGLGSYRKFIGGNIFFLQYHPQTRFFTSVCLSTEGLCIMSPPIWLHGPMFLLGDLCVRVSHFEEVSVKGVLCEGGLCEKGVSMKGGLHKRGSLWKGTEDPAHPPPPPALVSSGCRHSTYRNAYLYLNRSINYVFKYSHQIETHKIKYGCIEFLPKSQFVKKEIVGSTMVYDKS